MSYSDRKPAPITKEGETILTQVSNNRLDDNTIATICYIAILKEYGCVPKWLDVVKLVKDQLVSNFNKNWPNFVTEILSEFPESAYTMDLGINARDRGPLVDIDLKAYGLYNSQPTKEFPCLQQQYFELSGR